MAYHDAVRLLIPEQNGFLKFLLILVLLMALAEAQVQEGDWCLTDDGYDGICRPLRHCSELISKTYVYNSAGPNTPNLCSDSPYGGTIVCCPLNENLRIAPNAQIAPIAESISSLGIDGLFKNQNNANRPYQIQASTPSVPELRPVEESAEVSSPDPLPLRISEKKCQEYMRTIEESKRMFGIDDSFSRIEKCPTPAPPRQLIVGGTPAVIGQYPHMAALGYLKNTGSVLWLCSGSLISEIYVLTAAHCLTRRYGVMVVVRLGSVAVEAIPFSKVTSYSDSDGYYAVAEAIRHYDYNFGAVYNDIALIRMDKSVKFDNLVRPACLNVKPDVSGKATVSGYGDTMHGQSASDRETRLLRHVDLTIYGRDFCDRLFAPEKSRNSFSKGVDDDTMICAGEFSGGKDTCQGDSGGPLQVRNVNEPCMFEIIGVTSNGKGCGLPNTAGIYTKVSNYISWIESIVWPQ